jgi:hypothetical protein
VRLVTSSTFACDGDVVNGTITITNRGDSVAAAVQLTQAALVSPPADGSPLPQSFGDIGSNQSVSRNFSFGIYPSGSRVLRTRGTFGAGSQFGGTQIVSIPPCSAAAFFIPDLGNSWIWFWLGLVDESPVQAILNSSRG